MNQYDKVSNIFNTFLVNAYFAVITKPVNIHTPRLVQLLISISTTPSKTCISVIQLESKTSIFICSCLHLQYMEG